MFNMTNRLDRPRPLELTPVGIRDVDAEVWREIKAEAVRQGVPVARLLEAIWAFWDEHPREVADWLLKPPPTKWANHRSRYHQHRNEFFEQLGLRMGFDTVSKYARLLGLGELSGYNLPEEHPGAFPMQHQDFSVRFE